VSVVCIVQVMGSTGSKSSVGGTGSGSSRSSVGSGSVGLVLWTPRLLVLGCSETSTGSTMDTML
jgi:hypothetical protein